MSVLISQFVPFSPSHSVTTSLFFTSASLFFPCKKVHQYHFIRFHIYVLGLPSQLTRSRICLQCKRLGFNSWVRKVPWRRKWQPTPVFLPGEFHGQRSPAGYIVRGVARIRHDLATKPQPPHIYFFLTNFDRHFLNIYFHVCLMGLSFAVVRLMVNPRTMSLRTASNRKKKKRLKPTREYQHATVCGIHHDGAKWQGYHIWLGKLCLTGGHHM